MSFLGEIGFPRDDGGPSEIEDRSEIGRESEVEDHDGETIEAQLDEVLTYIIQDILRLPSTSLIYNQDEIMEVLDLITMSQSEIESISALVNGKERTIAKRDARLLTQFTWWHNDLASKMVNNEFPDHEWYEKTRDDFLESSAGDKCR